jgi:hypothetical protein
MSDSFWKGIVMRVNGFKIVFIVLIWIIAVNGFAKKRYDLATQKDIYTYTRYTSTQVLSKIILLNVVDRRPKTERLGGILADQTVDSDWRRPLEMMIADVITREMQNSGVIKLIPANRENYQYRLDIYIDSFLGGTKERQGGGAVKEWFVPYIAVGDVRLGVVLTDKSGKELFNVDFHATAEQEVGRMTNYHKASIRSTAMALQEAVLQIMKDLDNRLK